MLPSAKLKPLFFLPLLLLTLIPGLARAETRKEPVFVLQDAIARHPDPGQYPAYWDFLKEQGYNGLDLRVLDEQGNFYFYSPVLSGLGWTQHPDHLIKFLKSLRDRYAAPGSRPPLMALDLTPLARQAEGAWDGSAIRAGQPAPRDLGRLVLDLNESYRFDQILTEPFPFDSHYNLQTDAAAAGKRLDLAVVSPAFDDFLKTYDQYRYDSFASDKKELGGSVDRFVSEDLRPYPLAPDPQGLLPTVGLGDLVFALGRTQGKEVWAGFGAGAGFPPGSEHNLALYRAVQYAPEGFVLLNTGGNDYVYDREKFDFARDVKGDVLEFYDVSRSTPPFKKALANLILSSRGRAHAEPYLPQYIEPILNALLADGYEVKVTFGKFYDGAELYYVTNSEDWSRNVPFFKKLLWLLDERKSYFYGTVIVHPLAEISSSGRWRDLRQFFKVPWSETGWIPDLPAKVEEAGVEIPWKGTVAAKQAGMTRIRVQAVKENFGQVVLSTLYDNQTLALILKSGHHYLVNGNFLHFEAAYFLSKLMGGALQVPVKAYVTSDRNRTAALAIADTFLKLKVPALEPAQEWAVTVFDASGRRVQDTTVKGKAVLELPLNANELLVVKCRRD